MSIQPVSFAGNTTTTTPPSSQKKEIGTVGKGAIIGATSDIVINLLSCAINSESRVNMNKADKTANAIALIFLMGIDALLAAGVGAGIGKLIKNHNEKVEFRRAVAEKLNIQS